MKSYLLLNPKKILFIAASTLWIFFYANNIKAQCTYTASLTATEISSGTYQISMTNTLPGGFVLYDWNFGDNNTLLTTANIPVTHTYSFTGIAIVTLYVTNADSTACAYGIYTINVTQTACNISPDFIYTTNSSGLAAFSDNTVDNTPSQSITQWNWSFGDGSPNSSLSNPTHQYVNNGTYTVCLTVTNSLGCTDTVCYGVPVTMACANTIAVFYDSLIGSNQHVFYAYGSSPGGNTVNYSWTFGDGQFVTANPNSSVVHTYANSQSYVTCVTINFANGCSATYCDTISSCQLYPAFTYNVQSNNVLVLMGTATDGIAPYTYNWYVSGGSPSTAAGSVLTTIVAAPSAYVCLYATDANGCQASSCETVLMNNCNLTSIVNATISGNNTTLAAIATSNNPPYTYAWSNGANTQNISVSNSAAGMYCVTVSDANGCTSQACYTVQASSCNINFYSYSYNDSVYFYSTNSTGNVSYTINFGDGNFASGVTNGNGYYQTTHSYDSTGYYNVCIVSDNGAGCMDSFCNQVFGCSGINSDFSYTNVGNDYTFSVINPDTSLIYSWFVDNNYFGNNQTTLNYTFIYGGNHSVSIYADGLCFDSTTHIINISLANADTLSGYLWNDTNGNGLMDNGEQGIGQTYLYLCAGNDSINCVYGSTNANGYYQFIVIPGTYNITAYNGGNNYVQTFPVSPTNYTVTTTGGQNISGFNFGYQNQSSILCGTVFYDLNNNGTQDEGETGVAYTYVKIDGSWYYTNANGNYSATVLPGVHTLIYAYTISGYVITTATQYAVTTIIGQTLCGNDFGIYADPSLQNLTVNISAWTTVTPGFGAWYYISYCNEGVTAMTGDVTLHWDSHLSPTSFNPFSPVPTVLNTVNQIAQWHFTNLAPNSCDYIYFYMDAPTGLALGTGIVNLVTIDPISGDNYPLNNIDTIHQVVVGSWDPNDKQVSPSGVGVLGKIKSTQELAYTIQFQNTGSAPAVNVVLTDTISDKLDLSSFKINAASHQYTLSVDPVSRIIKWYFNNILLPDSGSNMQGSIGFVEFSIKPLSTIAEGAAINNVSDIYFDFNAAVRTNTTLNTIDNSLSIKNVSNKASVTVYPNPFTEATQFFVRTTNQIELSIVINNVVGQQIKVLDGKSNEIITFNRNEIASGIYTYTVKDASAKVLANGKLIVR